MKQAIEAFSPKTSQTVHSKRFSVPLQVGNSNVKCVLRVGYIKLDFLQLYELFKGRFQKLRFLKLPQATYESNQKCIIDKRFDRHNIGPEPLATPISFTFRPPFFCLNLNEMRCKTPKIRRDVFVNALVSFKLLIKN